MAYPGARYPGQYDATPPTPGGGDGGGDGGDGGTSHLLLHPVLTDDGWGGDLTFAWAQVSGPDTATITTPAALETDVTFPDVSGTYLFQITVSRALDDLVGANFWGVTVFSAEDIAPDPAVGDVVLIASGVAQASLINSVRITKVLQGPSSCTFALLGPPIAVFADVVLTRGAVRLFGGICLAIQVHYDDGLPIYQVSCVGYAWHLGRVRVTATYPLQSISTIARDLVARAPGGITDDFVAPNLPATRLVLDDVVLAEALTQLITPYRDLHWLVDDAKRLHLTSQEPAGDPRALDATHPTLRDLAVTVDGSQVVNRVTVAYTIATPIPSASEIRVPTLEGYAPGGGVTVIDGDPITYTGITSRLIDSVYGTVFLNLFEEAVTVDDGELPDDYPAIYRMTLRTALGETPVVSGLGGRRIAAPANAFRLSLRGFYGDPAAITRVLGVNVYRTTTEGGAGLDCLVGTFTVPIGTLDDTKLAAHLGTLIPPPVVNTADETGYFLTGVSGNRDTKVPARVTVEDVAAQAVLAARLGGGDTGVIAITLQGGALPAADAHTLAVSFLAQSVDVRASVSCSVEDNLALPGQTIAVTNPDLDVATSLKIQQTGIDGFERGVPHRLAITAAAEVVTLQDLLKAHV